MAVDQADHPLPVVLIDREIGITLNRTARSPAGGAGHAVQRPDRQPDVARRRGQRGDIDHLLEGDVVETTFAEFAHDRNDLYQPLIAERDRYIGRQLRAAVQRGPPRCAHPGRGRRGSRRRHRAPPGDSEEPAEVWDLLERVPPRRQVGRA